MASDIKNRERRPREDGLTVAIESLEHALGAPAPGRESDWAGRLEQALANLDSVLKQHVEAAEGADGFLGEVDLTRPSLTRKVGQIRAEHRGLPQTIRDLRQEVDKVRAAFGQASVPSDLGKTLPAPDKTTTSCDPGALRQQADQLLAQLKQHKEWEVDLLLESVNTDVGAGD